MLRSSFNRISWDDVEFVGFDLDGTLYDEAEFIWQAYEGVASRLAASLECDAGTLRAELFERWLEKGSSYPHIFEEAVARRSVAGEAMRNLVRECVECFRETAPSLRLPARVSALLDFLERRYRLFLVTDGSAALQTRKIEALGLRRWFAAEAIVVTGGRKGGRAKPSPESAESVPFLARGAARAKAAYFGDRDVDQSFAAAAGFQFQRVHVMVSRDGRAS